MVSRLAGKRSVLVAENVRMKVVMRACLSARWQSRTQTKTLMKSSCWPAWLGECGCYCGNKHAPAVSTPVGKNQHSKTDGTTCSDASEPKHMSMTADACSTESNMNVLDTFTQDNMSNLYRCLTTPTCIVHDCELKLVRSRANHDGHLQIRSTPEPLKPCLYTAERLCSVSKMESRLVRNRAVVHTGDAEVEVRNRSCLFFPWPTTTQAVI